MTLRKIFVLMLVLLEILLMGSAVCEDVQGDRFGMPLAADEITIESLSINELIERYGEPLRYETAYWPGNASAYVHFVYDDKAVTLMDSGCALSFAQDSPEGFDFGDKDISLTDGDRTLTLPISGFLWTDDTIALRGIYVGDSLQTVKSRFFDESIQYNDGMTLYWVEENGALGQYLQYDENKQLTGITYADSYLYYGTGYPESRNAIFYFMEDILVAVSIGYENEP